uniref:Uncharacterized protein n=1 Tax=Rhizophora mucronata TaxID=61149 RepID=A0A2P2QLJ5_RHIMU
MVCILGNVTQNFFLNFKENLKCI